MTRAALALVLVSATAYAQPKPDAKAPDKATRAKAAAMYEKGSAHYEAGRFSEAIPLFRDAYELVHDPVYLFNLAQSYRKVLDCERASEFYVRYLEEATDADAKQRKRVQGWLRELAPCVDERKTAAETARQAQEAAVRARREAEAARIQQGPTHRTIDNGRGFRIGGLAAAGLGAVGITLGIVYGVKGSNLKDELATACNESCDWSNADLRDKDEAGKRANTLSMIFGITGGVALAGGVALYFVGRSRVEHVQITPTPGGGATVQARFSF